jgi:hypothetical protein
MQEQAWSEGRNLQIDYPGGNITGFTGFEVSLGEKWPGRWTH